MDNQLSIMSSLESGLNNANGEIIDWFNTNFDSGIQTTQSSPYFQTDASEIGTVAADWPEISPRSDRSIIPRTGRTAKKGLGAQPLFQDRENNEDRRRCQQQQQQQLSQSTILFPNAADLATQVHDSFGFPFGMTCGSPQQMLFMNQPSNPIQTPCSTGDPNGLRGTGSGRDQPSVSGSSIQFPTQSGTPSLSTSTTRPPLQSTKPKRSRGQPKKHPRSSQQQEESKKSKGTAVGNGQLEPNRQTLTQEQKKKERAARNRISAEQSRLRRKQYTDELEREVGSLRETNKALKRRTIQLTLTLKQVDEDVDSAIQKGQICKPQIANGASALKAALMALGNARLQCPVTFADGVDRPDISQNNHPSER